MTETFVHQVRAISRG